jgi:hypothetical protein
VLAAVLGARAVEEEVEPVRREQDFALQHTPTRPLPPRLPFVRHQSEVAYKTEPARPAEEPTRPLRAAPAAPESGGSRRDDIAEQETAVLARPAAETAPRPVDNRCPYCHADISDAKVFCPRCGRVL